MLDDDGGTESDELLTEVEFGVLVDGLRMNALDADDGCGNTVNECYGCEAWGDGVYVFEICGPECVPCLKCDVLEMVSTHVEGVGERSLGASIGMLINWVMVPICALRPTVLYSHGPKSRPLAL